MEAAKPVSSLGEGILSAAGILRVPVVEVVRESFGGGELVFDNLARRGPLNDSTLISEDTALGCTLGCSDNCSSNRKRKSSPYSSRSFPEFYISKSQKSCVSNNHLLAQIISNL